MKPRKISTDRHYYVDEHGKCHDHVRVITEADYRYLRRVEKAAIKLMDWTWDDNDDEPVAAIEALRKALGGKR